MVEDNKPSGDIMDNMQRALLLISEINKALKSGTKHYNNAGKELTTIEEILVTLTKEGSVTFEPQGPVRITIEGYTDGQA